MSNAYVIQQFQLTVDASAQSTEVVQRARRRRVHPRKNKTTEQPPQNPLSLPPAQEPEQTLDEVSPDREPSPSAQLQVEQTQAAQAELTQEQARTAENNAAAATTTERSRLGPKPKDPTKPPRKRTKNPPEYVKRMKLYQEIDKTVTPEQIEQAKRNYERIYRHQQIHKLYHSIDDYGSAEYLRRPGYLRLTAPLLEAKRQMMAQQPGQWQTPDLEPHEVMEPVDLSKVPAPGTLYDPNGLPYSQPITALQLPKVRPTLCLGPYDTFEEGKNAAIQYAVVQGYMLIQQSSVREKDKDGKYLRDSPILRVDLLCDRAGQCYSQAKTDRRRPTHKLGCPAHLVLLRRRRDGNKWFIDPRCEYHNHDLVPDDMESIAAYRRWKRQMEGLPKETKHEAYLRLRARKMKFAGQGQAGTSQGVSTSQSSAQTPIPQTSPQQMMSTPSLASQAAYAQQALQHHQHRNMSAQTLPQTSSQAMLSYQQQQQTAARIPSPQSLPPLHSQHQQQQQPPSQPTQQQQQQRQQQQPPTQSQSQSCRQQNQPPPNPTSPLHMAAFKGQLKILTMLLDRGADVNMLDGTGRTPLHCAIEGKQLRAVQMLVLRGADISRENSDGLSPLHMAVESGEEEVVAVLLDRGADPNR